MKSHRIAVAVAAAAIAPALLLSAPAVAAGKPAAAAGSQTGVAAETGRAALSAKGPGNVTAGAWTELQLTVDNRAGRTMEDFYAGLDTFVVADDFKGGDSELEYRAKDGSWQQPFAFGGNSYSIDWGRVEKGAVFTIDVRVRYASHVAGHGVINASVGSRAHTGWGGNTFLSFDVQPADGVRVPLDKATDHSARVAFTGMPPESGIRAGGGWRQFQLVMDNRRGEADIANFKLLMTVGLAGRMQPGQALVDYRTSPGAPWQPWKVTRNAQMGTFGSLSPTKLAKGELRTMDVRLRIAHGAPTGKAVVSVWGGPEKKPQARSTTRVLDVTAG
ncbi:hypothetical protein [Streptomyces sp. NPDC017529]|uniref:hypothetical protein n=1 Tax=Streptomyces sp. NPDC017529 TaxID=3365000 RepID=UPI0037BA3ABA